MWRNVTQLSGRILVQYHDSIRIGTYKYHWCGEMSALSADPRLARLQFLRSKFGVASTLTPPSSTVIVGTTVARSDALALHADKHAVLGRAASCSSATTLASAESDLQRRAMLRWTMMPSSATLTASSQTAAPSAAEQPSQPYSPRSAFVRSVSHSGGKGMRSGHGSRAYRRLRQIGCGRFGEVYLVQEVATSRLLVLKSMHARNVDAPARLEARTLLKLRRHPNIISMHDAFDEGPERLNLVMEYADGGDLAARISRAKSEGASMAAEEALHVFVQVALALQHCHKHAVIHRDVKPANIFLTVEGIVRLGDFGLAKDFECVSALESGSKFAIGGTPLYLAPEILIGRS